MRVRNSKTVFYVVLFLFIAFTASISMQLELPPSIGTYTVGRMILHWVDTSRPEVLTSDLNDVRNVTVLIWYPSEPNTGTTVGYFPRLDMVANELIASGEVQAWEVLALRWVRSNDRLDAKPIRDQGTFPVILLSPGNGTNVEFYSGLAHAIASQGYVVVGINHPHDVAAVGLSNGTVATYDKNQWSLEPSSHQSYSAERVKVRAADLLFVLDQINRLNQDGKSPFAGILDLDSVAAMGHSLGGITASEACKADARFKACINLDGLQRGGPFSTDESAMPPDQPFLFLTKESQLHPKLIEQFESTTESYWVVIHGASHDSFTDGPLLQPSLLPLPNQADRLMNLIQKYTLAFLDQTLKGRPGGLLSKTVQGVNVSVHSFPSQP